jgi:hypothetical protein
MVAKNAFLTVNDNPCYGYEKFNIISIGLYYFKHYFVSITCFDFTAGAIFYS